jgi:hypothetical protein
MFNNSYTPVTQPPKIREGQGLKNPQGISSPLWKEAFSRPSSETVEKADFGSLGLLCDPNFVVCRIWG